MMNAKVYLVGGAVRDHLLGVQSRDRDYVVVGATPQDMLDAGFSQVGASFPVFLHPDTGDEYALARTERKTGVGYHGFEVFYDKNVTLVDDLRRRDLTINSMAMDLATGEVIDPFGGKSDLAKGVLRHTSEVFADDPLRVLRVARFAARYKFLVHPQTIDLGRRLVDELVHLPAERVWTELYKGFGEKHSWMMLRALMDFNALGAKPLSDYFGMHNHQYAVSYLQFANTNDADVNVLLSMNLASHDDQDLNRMKVPTHVSTAAHVTDRLLKLMLAPMSPDAVHTFLKVVRNDLASPTFQLAMKVGKVGAAMALRDAVFDKNFAVLSKAAAAVRSVDMAAVVASVTNKTMVKHVVDTAKFDAVKKSMA